MKVLARLSQTRPIMEGRDSGWEDSVDKKGPILHLQLQQ